MKHIAFVCMAGAILAGTLVMPAGAQSQSLGDYARAARKDKKPPVAKQYDNDNLPKNDKISIVGNAPQEPTETINNEAQAEAQAAEQASQAPAAEAKPVSQDTAKPATGQPGESQKDRQQMYGEWKQKISAQKDQVDLMSRELDVAQREYRLRAAAFYADAGNRIRNATQWDKEDAQYKQQLEQKQKALDAVKQQLEDLQEQARKAGVPAGMRE